MPGTPGRSRRLGLLLAIVASVASACRGGGSANNRGSQPADPSANRIKLLIQEDGMFRVTERTLVQAGLDLPEMSGSSLRLSKGDESVPLLFIDNDLVFCGQSPDSRYTNNQPYVLEAGLPGTPMMQTVCARSVMPLPCLAIPAPLWYDLKSSTGYGGE